MFENFDLTNKENIKKKKVLIYKCVNTCVNCICKLHL